MDYMNSIGMLAVFVHGFLIHSLLVNTGISCYSFDMMLAVLLQSILNHTRAVLKCTNIF